MTFPAILRHFGDLGYFSLFFVDIVGVFGQFLVISSHFRSFWGLFGAFCGQFWAFCGHFLGFLWSFC
jgi:hypothetical protein